MRTKFSFIIPTRNEADYLEDCIKSIKKQNRKNYEIIVVDTRSTDGTQGLAKKYGKLIKEPRRGTGLARNTGAERAKGDIIIFADADVRFGEDFLHKLEKEFEENIAGGICNLEAYDGGPYIRKMYDWVNHIPKFLIRLGKPVTAGSCFVYRKKDFHKVGGFRPEFITNEDHELARRMHRHKRFVFFHDIKVRTSSRRIRHMGFFRLLKLYIKSSAVYFLKGGYLREYE